MSAFDRIIVVFNPQSTGNTAQSAEELQDELRARLPDVPLDLRPTQHAGHARELAREAATGGRPLIVSVSGDGGYNEVVNGAMDAGNEEAVCAVRAAGNANDHRRVTRYRHLADAILAGDVRRIDLLRLTVGSNEEALVRYARSYVGVGLTPVVAVDLEQGGKGSWREILSVVRGFSRLGPFSIRREDGRRRRIDSLVLANIGEMAKYAKLSDGAAPDDGRFEVITQRQTGKLGVLATVIRAATRGLGPQPSVTHYAFTPLAPMPVQLDGELLELEPGAPVAVDIAPRALATVF